ncbi:CocE/NonD family hydrolase [Rhodanobacter sp. Col0626]|uniref:CocE/NonD family hydrolase n=1 Tax=Rhodanobacter sp. Col0626 TaxID=3415679 RepID=UPI003CEB4A7C
MAGTCAAQVTPDTPDIPARFEFPAAMFDYTVREAMIPMRDGIKLHTVIVLPRDVQHAPMVLTRTPYNASQTAVGKRARRMRDTLPPSDDVFADSGYIRVYQDVRGKYGSQGDYFMVPPLSGTINASKVDDSTDAWDTIDWLVHHVPESNGRVGMIGYSYDGFTVAMALIHPHPALKVAAPENPMIDSWMGDDWFHYGAFRNVNLGYFTQQTSTRGRGSSIPKPAYDDYTTYLQGGSAGEYAKNAGLEQLPFWQKIIAHPTYDAFWREQAIDRILAKQPLKVPTLWVQGLWDHVDMWGAVHSYAAMEPKDRANDMNYLVMGPWHHGQQNTDGSSLGVFNWRGDTALQYRRDMLKPFFDRYLVDGAPKKKLSPVTVYNAGENQWDYVDRWPLACDSGCEVKSRPLYLRAGQRLAFTPPTSGEAGFGSFVSDPTRPVPNLPRPNGVVNPEDWRAAWPVVDQRFVDGRPDVISYVSEPLTQPIQVSGAPVVHLYASTSGSDSDWVVKIIDVYPHTYPSAPAMGGYEFPLSMDIFRGRYRTSFEHPQRIEPDAALLYTFALPNINHLFQPGHRIMVQIQSSWFPLYDRNPQTYVESIFFAGPCDYHEARQKVWHTPAQPSSISMPITSGR